MRALLDKTRLPKTRKSVQSQIVHTMIMIVVGFSLGLLQKWIDGSADNLFPLWFQLPDIKNYFGRLAIWILLSVIISVYSYSPVRASINTFSFLLSMVVGYYLYSKFVLGFISISYMMIWVALAFVSIFLAYFCWYAKGEGVLAIIISGVIIGALFAQAFSIVQGFHIYNLMEVITWLAGIIVLYREPKELAIVIVLSIIFAFIYQLTIPYYE